MPKLTIEDLNQLYNESDEVDKEVFAEQRSNILLVSGDHYQRRNSRFWNRIRDNRELSDQQKLRLTKNHTQRISKAYVSNILGHAPGVQVVARNETDLSDQKSAEINHSVWQDAKCKYKLNAHIRNWCTDYVNIGETAVKVFWDPNAGEFAGYHQAVDEEGNPQFDEFGQMKPDMERPGFKGAFVFERWYGFNMFRAPEAQTWLDSRYVGYRKMAYKKDLEKQFEGREDVIKSLSEDHDETYVIFDSSTGSYTRSTKNQVMIREFYFRPCLEYPKGYFYIATPSVILSEGELPYGIFPVRIAAFEELPTTPRGRSMIKQLRPYQAEINRAASKMAEHQITLGDDKLIIMNGTKMTNAGQLPGVRALSVTGQAPTVLQGRDGSQYLSYMQSQISEMYDIAMVAEDAIENEGQLEAFTLLFRSIKNKKKFSVYAAKFEEFLVEICELYLALARYYLPDDAVIQATGKREHVNIAEFRNQKDGYTIKVEPMSDDIESQMGKQIVLNHVLQYVGPQLGKEDIGKLIRNMPYANLDKSFGDLTLDYDNATNDILALDRGEIPIFNGNDTHEYIIKRLDNRMRQADFRLLSPEIQKNYADYKKKHEEVMVQQQQAAERAQSGQVPSGGYLVACDFYVPTKENPNKTQRARVPYQALEWLIKKLEDQGMSLAKLEGMQQGTIAEMAQMLQSAQSGMPPNGMGGMPQSAQASAGGVMR